MGRSKNYPNLSNVALSRSERVVDAPRETIGGQDLAALSRSERATLGAKFYGWHISDWPQD